MKTSVAHVPTWLASLYFAAALFGIVLGLLSGSDRLTLLLFILCPASVSGLWALGLAARRLLP